jgi:hypothetical protein
MEPTKDVALEISVGQRVFIDLFGREGDRIKLSGPIVAIDAGVVRVLLESGSLQSLLRGTCVMVECREGAERVRFVSNLVDFEVSVDRGAQLLFEVPPHMAHLQTRKFNRYAIRVPVDYAVEGGRSRKGMTEDLGGNGARVATGEAVPLATSVSLEFDLDGIRCEGAGEVKHVVKVKGAEGFLWGVEFTRMDSANAARLWAFLKTRLLGQR